jgi:iron complex outermembrane receptor protein
VASASASASAAGEEDTQTSRRPASLLLLTLAATVARARAAEEGEPLGEVVVTAPPVAGERPAPADPTAFATVVDARSAPTRVETLAEALAETVGVQVRRFGGLGDFSTISVRGFAAGQVQIYLDGVPLSRADNETVNLADLPLDAVERVEVYRGATPLGFAQSAPGGVVNVVTRRPGDAPLTAASVSGGSFGTRKLDLARGARAGAVDYLAFAHYLGSEGNFSFIDDAFGVRREKERVNAGFDLGDLTARLRWRPREWLSTSVTSDSFVREEGVPGPGIGVRQARDTQLRTARQLAHLDVALTPGTIPMQANGAAYFLYDERHFEDELGELVLPTDTTTRSAAGGGQVLVRGALGSHHVPGLFVAASHEGFALRDRFDPAGPEPERARLRGTIAAEDEILAFGERVSLVPGVRWEVFRDDFPGSGRGGMPLGAGGVRVEDFVSPRVGLRVTPIRGLTVLGNLGRYARMPNLAELFGRRGVLQGDPDLRPEVALNRDVGIRLAPPAAGLLGQAALEYAFFENDVDDLIVLVPVSLTLVRPQNVSRARLRGHEAVVRARLWERLGLIANYTYQDARDEGPVPHLQGRRLPGRPAHEGFARLELSWSRRRPLPLGGAAARLWPGRFFYELNVIADNFLDRANTRRVTERVLHGLGLELELPLPGMRVGLEAKNVGDDRTADVLGFPLPGRAFFATLSYGFDRPETSSRVGGEREAR